MEAPDCCCSGCHCNYERNYEDPEEKEKRRLSYETYWSSPEGISHAEEIKKLDESWEEFIDIINKPLENFDINALFMGR